MTSAQATLSCTIAPKLAFLAVFFGGEPLVLLLLLFLSEAAVTGLGEVTEDTVEVTDTGDIGVSGVESADGVGGSLSSLEELMPESVENEATV